MEPAMTSRAGDDIQAMTQWAGTIERLRRIALALTRCPDAADDLTQQTLVTLLAKSPDRADHIGYGRTTMVRLWLDQQRSMRRRLIRLARLALSRTHWFVESDTLADRDRADRVYGAIDELPARQRAVLTLRLVEELDYAQIAKALDCSVATVRSNLHLARQRVRDRLEEAP